jgi:ABC-2 type transport system permease protein
MTVGLVMAPQMVAQSRLAGTFDYIWSLPIPRMVYIAADSSNLFASMLPGIVIAVIFGAIHFDFSLSISPLVIPAVIMIAACATFLGYSIAFAVPKPMMAMVLTQVIIFIVMMFSPVMYPAEQMPQWLQSVHQVLPIKYMANLMRGTLTDLPVNLGMAFGIVGAWLVAAFFLTYSLVRRRN